MEKKEGKTMYTTADQLRFDVLTKLDEAKKENKELVMSIRYADKNMFQCSVSHLDEEGNIISVDNMKFHIEVLVEQIKNHQIAKIRFNLF